MAAVSCRRMPAVNGRNYSSEVAGNWKQGMNTFTRCRTLFLFFFVLASCQTQGASTTTHERIKSKTALPTQSFKQRNRDRLEESLKSRHLPSQDEEAKTLKSLSTIYQQFIKPLAEAYKYDDINDNSLSEGDIVSPPRILFLGPWSTGKSSILNYLLDIENSTYSLQSGATPTTTDFTVLNYGQEYHKTDGDVLALESSYASLRKFGHGFLKKLQAQRMPNKLLQKVTFIDTPGIIENQKQQERGYPFTEVCQWFIQRADMIILVFDPTKLDMGTELEKLFRQLKGFESKVYIVLNKADSVAMQELLRVYSALFWNLSPLMNVTEPPRVYLGSFWSKNFNPEANEYQLLFQEEELGLLSKMEQIVRNRLQTRAVALRQHAIMVRNHALMVNQFYHVLKRQSSIFKDMNEVIADIAAHPEIYKVRETVLYEKGVSLHDIVLLDRYRDFFARHRMDSFLPLSGHCTFFGACLMDNVEKAIHIDLPLLIEVLEVNGANDQQHCTIKNDRKVCSGKYNAKSNYSP